jgi:glutamate dehydrogenase/leucine dehydrogenase
MFVPDYLANAGGVIDFHQEKIDDRPEAVLAAVGRIGAITRNVLRRAAEAGATPLSVADGIVRTRIQRAWRSRAGFHDNFGVAGLSGANPNGARWTKEIRA